LAVVSKEGNERAFGVGKKQGMVTRCSVCCLAFHACSKSHRGMFVSATEQRIRGAREVRGQNETYAKEREYRSKGVDNKALSGGRSKLNAQTLCDEGKVIEVWRRG